MEPNTPPSAVPPEYEFTPEQNQSITDLARKMRLVGFVLVVVGVLGILAGGLDLSRNLGSLIQGLLNVFLGFFTLRGSIAFRQIVTTRGRDISFLMDALRSLGWLYGLFYWLIVCFVVAMVVYVVVLILLAARVGVDRVVG